jgi:hypothetical protein
VGEYGNVTRTTDGGPDLERRWPRSGPGPASGTSRPRARTRRHTSERPGLSRSRGTAAARWASLQSGGTGATHALDAVDPPAGLGRQRRRRGAVHDGRRRRWQRVAVSGFDNFGRIQDLDFVDATRGWAVGRDEFFGGGFGRVCARPTAAAAGRSSTPCRRPTWRGSRPSTPDRPRAWARSRWAPLHPCAAAMAGRTWQGRVPVAGGVHGHRFRGRQHGLGGGRGHLQSPRTRVRTWVQQFVPGDLLYSVSFADALHGWAVGWGPTILRTTDGGETWTPQSAPGATNVDPRGPGPRPLLRLDRRLQRLPGP